MRLIAFVLALSAVSAPASAQSWKEYSYPDYAFRVSFPAEPTVETTAYPTADGHAVPAQIYSVAQDNGVFKMTVADLTNAGLEENAVIDHAVAALSRRTARSRSISRPGSAACSAGSSAFWAQTAAVPRSRCSIMRGGSIRSRENRFPTATPPPTPSGFSNLLSSPTTPRTAPRETAGRAAAIAPVGAGAAGMQPTGVPRRTPAPDAAKFDCRNPAGATAPN